MEHIQTLEPMGTEQVSFPGSRRNELMNTSLRCGKEPVYLSPNAFIIHHIITSCPRFYPVLCQTPTSWKVFQSSFCPLSILHAAHLSLLRISRMPTPDSPESAISCSARAAARSLLLSVLIWLGWEASEGGASRCLGLLAEVSTWSHSWLIVCGQRPYAN
jgi:hypothetical protein